MTLAREQILMADNEQLDTCCAELIMGWRLHEGESDHQFWVDKDAYPIYLRDYYMPTTDIAQAFALLDHLNATRQWECHASFMPDDLLWQGNGNRYVATVWAYGENRYTRAFEMGEKTLPLAIVKACLLAVSYADGGVK